MENPKRYTITAALPYTNGPVHIGHLAGVYIPADIYARYQRLNDKDVLFVCGSDEHGIPITITAKKLGVSPQDVVDKYHPLIEKSMRALGISFDNYSRTSAEIHHSTASEFFKTLYENGKFEEREAEQFYDEQEGEFLADRYISGTCPNCKNDGAYGDQCEKCGSTLSPNELINPTSALSGNQPILKKTKHWYLPLNEYEDFLKTWILEGHKSDWKSNVYGQVKSWVDAGLQPRAVTRDLNWGIPVPVEGAEGKVLYVWFDAPIGYISASKEWSEKTGKDWESYWKSEDSKLLHFIGKDNIVFHCIIFPTMLKAHGDFILPDNVPANEFLNLEGDKISTSRNWAVWLHEYLEEFPGKEDVLRYVLCATAPENKDNDFTWKDFQARNNNELVAILGNFVNRVMVLCKKYYEGKTPKPSSLHPQDEAALKAIEAYPERIAKSIEQYRFREALAEFMNLARYGNKFLADEEPWMKIKTDPERVASIMHVALEITASLAVLAEPFLPFTANKLKSMLNWEGCTWSGAAGTNKLEAVSQLGESALLFQKIEDDEIQTQLDKLEAKTPVKAAPQKETIEFDTFTSLDIRSGIILSAEKVKKADKLLKLTVDTGLDQRTIVSGIAEHFSPEEIVGKTVSVLMNLAPRKIRGVQSQGMVLMAEDAEGKLYFVSPSEAKAGMEIR